MNRRDLARYVRELGGGEEIQLREAPVSTSTGTLALAHARISHGGRDVDGYGVADTKASALDKALWETVERYFFFFSRFTAEDFEPFSLVRRLAGRLIGRPRLASLENLGVYSVGCAVQSSRRRAAQAAVAELIERHTILAAQLKSVPGRLLRNERVVWNGMDVDVSCYAWQGPLKTMVVLNEMILAKDGSALFSSGAGDSVERARAKSWLEGLSLLENFLSAAGDSPELEGSRSIRDLMRWHKQNRGRDPFYRGARPSAGVPLVDAELSSRDFWVTVKALKPGLFFARAYSPNTQNLFVGHWGPKNVHPRFQRHLRENMEPPYAY